jgi:iron complex transport system substrate-binding protein
MFPPERIVCLTEETVETLYLLGEDRRIVGVSGYAVRPPQVRREKPRVSAFISADVPKILGLKPDLVFTFSDLQADIVAELIRNNVAVHAFNQRDIRGILDMICTLGALVGVSQKANALASSLAAHVDAVHTRSLQLPRRPRIYFEEWDEPMISGIAWVSELIEAAGGIDVFPQLAARKSAKDRIVSPGEVIAAKPDILIWLLVRQEIRTGESCRTSGLFQSSRSCQWLATRDQIRTYSPAGARRAHRWTRSTGGNHFRMG